MKKILIAGGAGFIGTRLSNKISSKYNVTVMDHFWFGDMLNDNITKIKQDINTIKTEDLIGYDAVLFLAGLSNDPMAMYRPDLNFIENSATPTYLAFCAKEAGVKRFICASSCSVYGHTKNKTLNEKSKVKPSYAYGISKLQCEKGITILEDNNFKPILFRKGTVGGWSPKMRFDLVVNTMLMTALTKKKITINSPKLWRPLIDIKDVIQAYELAIEVDLDITGVYNISGGNYTIGDLGKLIFNNLKERGYNIELETLNVKDFRNYKVDISKVKDELGFNPKYNPNDSIQEILDNIEKSENFNLENESYYNIKTFKKVI
jgi:nucleoside-diphosphate-sugar epimerase